MIPYVITVLIMQFFGLNIIFFVGIKFSTAFIKKEITPYFPDYGWEVGTDMVDTSVFSIINNYKYHYRYWYFVVFSYEIVVNVIEIILEEFNQRLIYYCFGAHLLYIFLIFWCKPSQHKIIHILSIVSVCFAIIENAAVVIEIETGVPIASNIWLAALLIFIPCLLLFVLKMCMKKSENTMDKIYEKEAREKFKKLG